MLPHDEDCIKIYSNAIFSEHYWDLWWADPFLIMLTKGSVFYLQNITYSAFTTFKCYEIRRRLIMQYFIIEKNCKNACRLLCAGDDELICMTKIH